MTLPELTFSWTLLTLGFLIVAVALAIWWFVPAKREKWKPLSFGAGIVGVMALLVPIYTALDHHYGAARQAREDRPGLVVLNVELTPPSPSIGKATGGPGSTQSRQRGPRPDVVGGAIGEAPTLPLQDNVVVMMDAIVVNEPADDFAQDLASSPAIGPPCCQPTVEPSPQLAPPLVVAAIPPPPPPPPPF